METTLKSLAKRHLGFPRDGEVAVWEVKAFLEDAYKVSRFPKTLLPQLARMLGAKTLKTQNRDALDFLWVTPGLVQSVIDEIIAESSSMNKTKFASEVDTLTAQVRKLARMYLAARPLKPGMHLIEDLSAIDPNMRMIFIEEGSQTIGSGNEPGYYLDFGGLHKMLVPAEEQSSGAEAKAKKKMKTFLSKIASGPHFTDGDPTVDRPVKVPGLSDPTIKVGLLKKTPSHTVWVVAKNGQAVGTIRKATSRSAPGAWVATAYPNAQKSFYPQEMLETNLADTSEPWPANAKPSTLKDAVLWVAQSGKPLQRDPAAQYHKLAGRDYQVETIAVLFVQAKVGAPFNTDVIKAINSVTVPTSPASQDEADGARVSVVDVKNGPLVTRAMELQKKKKETLVTLRIPSGSKASTLKALKPVGKRFGFEVELSDPRHTPTVRG